MSNTKKSAVKKAVVAGGGSGRIAQQRSAGVAKAAAVQKATAAAQASNAAASATAAAAAQKAATPKNTQTILKTPSTPTSNAVLGQVKGGFDGKMTRSKGGRA